MKTQIIQLESHDDTISVKDKMGWSQTPRILLVWPKHSKILTRQIDLLLLKRHSTLLGSQLAFVTKDSNVRYYAESLDIPVYRNIRKAEKTHWRPSRRQRRKKKVPYVESFQNYFGEEFDRKNNFDLVKFRKLVKPVSTRWLIHPVIRLIFFTLGVLGVLAIAAVLVPNAEIKISPQTQWQEVVIPVIGSSEIDSIDYSGVVPIRTISVTIEGRGQIATSGKISIPFTRANGQVIFTNLTDQEISIPAGTVISSSSKDSARFRTTETGTVASGTESDLIPIEAIDPGSKSNVPPKHLSAIEGPLGLDLAVTNPLGIFNGKDQVLSAPNEVDYETLLSETISKLHEAALSEFALNIGPEDVMLKADREDYQILEEIYTPEDIQPSDKLQIKLRADFHAKIISGKDLEQLGKYFLKANLPDNYFPTSSSTIIVEQQNQTIMNNNGIYQRNIKVGWQIGASIEKDDIIPFLLWQEPEVAAENLRTRFPLEDNISITINPDWWPRLPILPFRLKIEIQN